ncbi:uncharacterized protein LOC143030639 [Oratosquilla oratoria]|uniref:uncharacterized protein LOC143030639 n=1 Tax=Oratosquilla oratoria TaxID=337810 RepID=UPI003F768740
MEINVQDGNMPDSSMNRGNLLNKSINTREGSLKDTGSDAVYFPKSPGRRTADTNGFTCGLCSATFTRSSRLKAHSRVHTGEGPHKCSLCCESSFTWPGDLLRRHLRTHTGEKPYTCTRCKAAFSGSAGNLKRHVRTHTREKPECAYCQASFSQFNSLKSHRTTHTGQKPFKCTVCQASFKQSCSLSRHMIIHANEKPFMRTNTDGKPYATTVRQSSFSQEQGSTKCCMRTRSSGKPFKCDHCTLSFHQSSELKSHVKTHAVLGSFHGHEAADNFDLHENKTISAPDVSSHHIGYMSHTCTKSYSQKEVKEEPNVTESSYDLSISQENMEIKIEEHDLDLEMTATVEQDMCDG